MMKEEFEAIAGYEVSREDYDNIIEPMYMAVRLSKHDFVKCIDKKQFALRTEKQLINRMKVLAAHIKETCDSYRDFEAWEELEDLRREYTRRFHEVSYHERHTGDDWGCPGRGCAYPYELTHWWWDKITNKTKLIAD